MRRGVPWATFLLFAVAVVAGMLTIFLVLHSNLHSQAGGSTLRDRQLCEQAAIDQRLETAIPASDTADLALVERFVLDVQEHDPACRQDP